MDPRQFRLSRRQAVQTAMLVGAGIAVGGRGTPIAAQTPELAADQTLRFGSTVVNASVIPAKTPNGAFSMLPSTFALPFYADPSGAIVPGLCTAWSVSADGLVYTLTVDPEARFSDGSPVTAGDIKYSWEILSHPETGIGFGNFVVGSVAGFRAVQAGETFDMTGLRAIDAGTLDVTLSQPFTPFIPSLTQWIAGIVSRAQAESDPDWEAAPLACGPFMIDAWSPDTGDVSWVRNPFWPGQQPAIERVTYRAVPDTNALLILWENDELDFVHLHDDLIRDQLLSSSSAAQVVDTPNIMFRFLQFDTALAPMDDPDVRRAFRHATDIATIVPAVFEGSADPAAGLITPNIAGFRDLPAPFDPDAARGFLAASRYGGPDGLPPITYRAGNALATRLATAFQAGWREVLGVEVAVVSADQATQEGLEAQLFVAQDGSVVPDPSSTIYEIGHSRTSYMQNGNVADPEVDALLDEANALPAAQLDERIARYQQAEDLILDQAYLIPLLTFPIANAIKPWVRNLAGDRGYAIAMPSLLEAYLAAR